MTESRVLAILFADVVGSTERLGRLGPEAGPRDQGDLLGAMGAAITARDGTLVKELGDGIMATFESVRAAAAAAAAVDMAETAANLERPDWAEDAEAALEPWDGQLILHVCTYVPASVSYLRGRLAGTLGRDEEAVQRLETALAFEEPCGAESLAARTREELAAARLRLS